LPGDNDISEQVPFQRQHVEARDVRLGIDAAQHDGMLDR
jgi:hypothetical protein